jgi:putative membrane protein insertion efficiency factor
MHKSHFLARILIKLVRLYQITLSPYFGRACRFQPTCSAYMITALENHGAMRGGLLGLSRICRCHPWGGFGFDPVPPCGKSADLKPPSPLPRP